MAPENAPLLDQTPLPLPLRLAQRHQEVLRSLLFLVRAGFALIPLLLLPDRRR